MTEICSLPKDAINEEAINRTLRMVGTAQPRLGFDRRLLAHLENAAPTPAASLWFRVLSRRLIAKPGAPRLAFETWALLRQRSSLLMGGIAAGLLTAGAAVLIAIHPAGPVNRPTIPIRAIPSGGFGAASAARLPNQVTHPAPHVASKGRGIAHARQGRAVLSSPLPHRANGASVTRSPYAADPSGTQPQ